MPKIKLFEKTGHYNDDDKYITELSKETPWEEISEIDYKILQKFVKDNIYGDTTFCLISEYSYSEVKPSILQYLSKIKEEEEKTKLINAKNLALKESKRKIIEKQLIVKKMKQLERLQKELGVGNTTPKVEKNI